MHYTGFFLSQRDTSVITLFPSTSNSVVDIGLQVFAAALIGKIICLIVALPVALVRVFLIDYKSLEAVLTKIYGLEQMEEIKSNETNLLEAAVKHLSLADSYRRVTLERHRIRIITAYGACILIIIFLIYFCFIKYEQTNFWVYVGFLMAGLVFIVLGILEQKSLAGEAVQSLIALDKIEEKKLLISKKDQE